jgi:hypothetical protein
MTGARTAPSPLDFTARLDQGCGRREGQDMSDKTDKPNRQQVYTLLVQIGRKAGDGLPDGATGAALMVYASGVDEAEAVRETVAILKQADCAPLDVTGYGTLRPAGRARGRGPRDRGRGTRADAPGTGRERRDRRPDDPVLRLSAPRAPGGIDHWTVCMIWGYRVAKRIVGSGMSISGLVIRARVETAS